MSPRFSIVIPTRNRAPLVPGAIANAREQRHDDYEIVVSDNSDDDATRRAVDAVTDDRLRYVRTGAPLLMHDSWRFAMAQARGDYVTFLCDDDAHHPRMLTIVDRVIREQGADLVFWGRCGWCASGSRTGREATTVEFRTAYSDRVYDVDRDDLVDAAYAMRITNNDYVPRMLNAMVSRALVERAEAAGAPLFRPSCPDYSSMLATMLHAERPVLLDAPLSVTGLTPLSTGWTSARRAAVDPDFVDGLHEREPAMIRFPLLVTVSGWIAQTYTQCAAEYPALAGRVVDRAHAYGIAGQEIAAWRGLGFDVAAVEAAFERAVAAEPAEVAAAARAFVLDGRAIETDRFLRAAVPGATVLGRGPFAVTGGDGGAAPSIGAFAAGLDRWLDRHGDPVAGLWDAVAARAEGRACVVYGLGNGGRTLCRCAPDADHPLAGRLLAHDDGHGEAPAGFARLAGADELDPAAHLVLVTPIAHAAIAERLAARGFVRGTSWASVGDLATRAAAVS